MEARPKPTGHLHAQKGFTMSTLPHDVVPALQLGDGNSSGGKIIPFAPPSGPDDNGDTKIAAMFRQDINNYCHTIRSYISDYVAYSIAHDAQQSAKYLTYVNEDCVALLNYIVGQLNHKFGQFQVGNLFNPDIQHLRDSQTSAAYAVANRDYDEANRYEAEASRAQQAIVARLIKMRGF